MSRIEFGNGLSDHPGFRRDRIAIFFDNEYQLLEAPTKWIISIAKRKSRSSETSRNYAHILGRYLDWLDLSGYGSQSWQWIDEDIFDSYLLHLAQPKTDGSTIQHKTLLHYASRIHDFYSWARHEAYPHHLDIEIEEINLRLDAHQHLLGHLATSVSVNKLDFNLPTGRPTLHQRELDKFVTHSDYEAAMALFDDPVFMIIAAIIRITGMRPKDLLQLPYRGKRQNSGFIPFDSNEMPSNIDETEIHYEFASKGRSRSIAFPGKLWRVICENYLPLRRERAILYYRKHGISPPNSALFLTAEGTIVTYPTLYYHFSKIPIKAAELNPKTYKGRRFSACMLRHTCATYFVYEALQQKKRLGQSFVYDASLDEELRKMLGHKDVKTTLEYYVHLVNRFVHDDLLQDLKRSQVDVGLSVILNKHQYGEMAF